MPEVGDVITAENARWGFSGDKAEKFAKHIEKSIPGYRRGHLLVLQVSDFFIREKSRIYDLGCTIGTLTENIATRYADKDVEVIGIDREPSLIETAKKKSRLKNQHYELGDIKDFPFKNCDLIVSYYTLQFISPRERHAVLKSVWKCLNPGGAFVLFEKIREPTSRYQDIITLLYNDFKLENGYSGNEIIAKSRSLKGILDPFSSAENMNNLKNSGFSEVSPIFKELCFEGYLAIKD